MAGQILFCPFCRECFEGEEVCPEHELALVPFDRLPRGEDEDAEADAPVAGYDLRYGRGVVLLGALLMTVGFMVPFLAVTVPGEEAARESTGFALATTVALNLWTVPGVAFALVSVLARRRTFAAMRAVRLALPLLALLSALSAVLTYGRVAKGAAQMTAQLGATVEVGFLGGFWLVLAGAGIAAAGGLVLGIGRNSARR